MLKPRALAAGDRIAVVAPASPFSRDEFDAGVAELRRAGIRSRLRGERLRAPGLRRGRRGACVPTRFGGRGPTRRFAR